VILFPYDAVSIAADCKRMYFLSERTRVLLETQCEYLSWKVRYHSETGQVIGDEVADWAAMAQKELSMPGFFTGDEECMDDTAICALVAKCFDSGALDESVINWLKEHGMSGATKTTPTASVAGDELLIDCDLDLLFGGVTQTVDFLHTLLVDFMQKIVAETNTAQKLALILSGIPVVGWLPSDEMIEAGVQLVEDIAENYYAAYDEDIRLMYRCDLFCLAQENCTLNLFGMAVYFFEKAAQSIVNLDWNDLMELLLEGTFSGEELVHVAHGLLAFTLCMGSKTLGLDGETFFRVLRSFFNDADPDWEVLCEECPKDWEHVQDFTVVDGQGLWVEEPDPDDGGAAWHCSYTSEQGWVSGDGVGLSPNDHRRTISIICNIPSTTITSVDILYDLVSDNLQQARGWGKKPIANDHLLFDASQQGVGLIAVSDVNPQTETTDLVLFICCSQRATQGGLAGSILLRSVTVRGRGINPFI